jgi:hypothetical protein
VGTSPHRGLFRFYFNALHVKKKALARMSMHLAAQALAASGSTPQRSA